MGPNYTKSFGTAKGTINKIKHKLRNGRTYLQMKQPTKNKTHPNQKMGKRLNRLN